MNMDRVAGIRLEGYGEYLQAEQLANHLTAINPALPVRLVLTSWQPQAGHERSPDPTHLDGEAPVYADVRSESPSRLEHFIELLAQMRRQTRQLNAQLQHAARKAGDEPAEVADESPWLTSYLNQDG